jgi:hypothetical protein
MLFNKAEYHRRKGFSFSYNPAKSNHSRFIVPNLLLTWFPEGVAESKAGSQRCYGHEENCLSPQAGFLFVPSYQREDDK